MLLTSPEGVQVIKYGQRQPIARLALKLMWFSFSGFSPVQQLTWCRDGVFTSKYSGLQIGHLLSRPAQDNLTQLDGGPLVNKAHKEVLDAAKASRDRGSCLEAPEAEVLGRAGRTVQIIPVTISLC